MTLSQFQSLKVGSRVYIPDLGRPKQMMSTEVLSIDRIFRKVKVLCGGDRFLSYRYVRASSQDKSISLIVGMCEPICR